MALLLTKPCRASAKSCPALLLSLTIFFGAVRTAPAANPLALREVGSAQLTVLSPTLVELSLVTTKDPDPAPVTKWNFVGPNFSLSIPAASEFSVDADGSAIPVSEVGFKRRPLYAPLKSRDLRIGNYLYLRLAKPIADGQSITVRNPSGTLWSSGQTDFSTSSDPYRFNPAIHVNQVGYLPNYTKKAMVGYYLGSLGELPIAATSFNVLDANTKEVRFSGVLTARKDVGFTYTPAPYQNVLEADFTQFGSTGEYVLQVPGMGTSYPFLIHNGTAAAFARTVALGLYHQRCGMDNSLPFTRHEHGVCHAALAAVPDMTYQAVNYELANMSSDFAGNPLHTAPQLKDVNSSLYPFVNKGPIDVRGGHHDAGDYSRYTINSAGLIHHLVFAADSFPGVGALDNLGMPESGDGKSDILQEAKWEADFLAKMQDADGGFYFLVYPRDREYENDVLPDHGDPQVVFPKTTAVTAAAVGALAEISSSPVFRAQFPTEAAAYLDKARRGWGFLTNAINRYGKNGSYQKITHYGNEFMHDDELAWAAAGLFVATGEPAFHAQLKAWYDPSDPNTRRWSWWRLFEGYGCAARAYAFAARSGRLPASALDPVYLAKCEAEIIAAGDDIARFAQQTAYGASFPDPNKSFRTAGWFFSSERSFEAATAQQLRPSASYIDAVVSNLNYEGGCNPINVPYITGIGWQRWRDIVHQYAQNDYQVLPPSGIPLGNVQGGFAYLENYKLELGQLCYPPDGASVAPYPFYDRWGDSFNTTTEFVVMDQSRALATLAFLFARSGYSAPTIHPNSTISGLPASTPAGESVTATFNVPGVDLTGARIVWEARDQQPSIGSTFTFAAKNPGVQWVELEAMLPDGTRIFCKTNFTASFATGSAANADQPAPLSPAPELAALYHLDGTLADATGRNPALTLAGNANFDGNNLGWMQSRSGKALRFLDLGDKATVTINGPLFTSGVTTEITVEAMVYVNAYKAWNRSPARLLSLEKSWNASLKWNEDMYTGAHVSGGTGFDFTGAGLSAAMPVQQWHHLVISIGPNGYAVKVNGATLASVASSEFANWASGGAALEFGNFDGWVDEVAVRSRTVTSAPPVVTPVPPVTPPPANLAPVVTLTKPTPNIVLGAPATVIIEASASDPDGIVKKVEFYADGTKIGEASGAPFSYTWTCPIPGQCAISAIAIDNAGAQSAPSSVNLSVVASAPVAPANLQARGVSTSQINLSWTDLADNESGYRVYRSGDGVTFTLVGTTAANAGSWSDVNLVSNTSYTYAVRAFNSAGESTAAVVIGKTVNPAPPATPLGLAAIPQGTKLGLSWSASAGADTYIIKRSLSPSGPFTTVANGITTASYADSSAVAGLTYYYTIYAQNAYGSSIASPAMAGRLDSPTANIQFLGTNVWRKGTWKGQIGADGYLVAGDAQQLPAYVSAGWVAKNDWTWQGSSSDARCLQRTADSSRVAACWYSSSYFELDLRFTDGKTHRVAFQCLDWDRLGRNEQISIYNAETGKLLIESKVAAPGEGPYLEYLLQGHVRVRVTNNGAPNAVLNGVFFDPVN